MALPLSTPISPHNASNGASFIPIQWQTTLQKEGSLSGIGLHSGQSVKITFVPQLIPHQGIRFIRTDKNNAVIEANWRSVADTRWNTKLRNADGIEVGTVEHLMSALAGAEIDNLDIYIDGPEVPIMDGSAAPFSSLIEAAGTQVLANPRRRIRVLKTITVEGEGTNRWASLSPADHFSISFEFDRVAHQSVIPTQTYHIKGLNGQFRRDIAAARTFNFFNEQTFLVDIEKMRSQGFALGGSLENAVIVTGTKVLNAEGLRYEDEFVRHKILDVVGDLYLAGAPLIGHFHGVNAGHTLNHLVLERLFKDTDAWCYE